MSGSFLPLPCPLTAPASCQEDEESFPPSLLARLLLNTTDTPLSSDNASCAASSSYEQGHRWTILLQSEVRTGMRNSSSLSCTRRKGMQLTVKESQWSLATESRGCSCSSPASTQRRKTCRATPRESKEEEEEEEPCGWRTGLSCEDTWRRIPSVLARMTARSSRSFTWVVQSSSLSASCICTRTGSAIMRVSLSSCSPSVSACRMLMMKSAASLLSAAASPCASQRNPAERKRAAIITMAER
mmetsp:Transcript_4089/g.15129  ORF Transcript_4089/g.15129 Transcript_4089/m.15129 type:complete len:243 (-) Transcript_4089:733-1461(-)